MKKYCHDDFIFEEDFSYNYFKAKIKNGSDYYYIKKYTNINFDDEKIKKIQKVMFDLCEITKLKFYGYFYDEKGNTKDLFLIFEYFEGKMVCKENYFQNYELWFIARNVLEIFEQLSEKGIKFPKLKGEIDVFEIKINEIKINIFELIKSGLEENKENKENRDNSGIIFSLGTILEKILDGDNYVFKGFINDLKNNKLDILTLKKLLNLFLIYSINIDNTYSEIIYYKDSFYTGSLKDDKPDGEGALINEFGIIYKGEFKEGKINGKGKSYLYEKKIEIINKKPKTSDFRCGLFGERICQKKIIKSIEFKNLLKIYEGNFNSLIKNGKYIEYNSNKQKIYEGEYKNDKRDGKGIEYNNGIKVYEGEYKDDMRNGIGIEYINGIKIYEGAFENNKYHGKGCLFYNNGKTQYIGNFNNGIFFGDGIYYDVSGGKIKVSNGLPLLNIQFPKYFNIYYNSGKIHYKISLENKKDCILKGKEYNSEQKLIYSGNFKTQSIYEKQKEQINIENYIKNETYIILLKDGYGTNYISDEQIEYRGGFKYNCYNGQGILYNYTYDNVRYIQYDGCFLNGQYNGEGIEYFYHSKNKKYEGKFKNGIYNGHGIQYKEEGGEIYKGIFKDGHLIKGTEKTEYYVGQIDNGVREGKGKQYINKKLRFDGLFKKGKFIEGIVYDINNKKFFEGKISEDNRIEGKFYNEDNNFEGKFEDFCKSADYIIIFTNDCNIIFEGEFKNGMKCGYGRDYLNNYEGEFLYDMYHGKGKYSYDFEGEFKNGKKSGIWKEYNYEGYFKNGIKDGKGIENSWTVYYVNNYLHGISTKGDMRKIYYFGEEANILDLKIEKNCIYYKGIKEYEGDLVNGVKNGNGIEYYKNSKKRYEGSFKNGKHQGIGKEYYDNEILKYDGEFNDGDYDKKGIEYDETGKKIYEGEFKKGKYHGKGKLYRNGKIIYEGDFIENKLQGKGKEFNKDGNVIYSGEFENNCYEGFGTKYSEKPYEGYWSKNRQAKLKQGLYYIGKYFNIIN